MSEKNIPTKPIPSTETRGQPLKPNPQNKPQKGGK